MGYMCTIEYDVELLYICDYMNGIPFYSFKLYNFKDLKKGDKFRLRLSETEQMTRCSDKEVYTCASDAYYDNLTGWKVELED